MIKVSSNIVAVCSGIPRRIRIDVTRISLLDLAHGRTAAADSTTDGTTLACHGGEDESGDEGSPAKPQERRRGLSLATVLLKAGRAVGDAVETSVVLGIYQLLLVHYNIRGSTDRV